MRIERTGSERQFQRLAQEYAANIFAPDVINASDAAHFIAWKRNGWLAPFVPEEVARFYPAEHRDPDCLYATSRVYVSSLGYNTNLVKAEDAPRSLLDLLHPKAGRSSRRTDIADHHDRDLPDRARACGWGARRRRVLQSSVDPPAGARRRAVMADGSGLRHP